MRKHKGYVKLKRLGKQKKNIIWKLYMCVCVFNSNYIPRNGWELEWEIFIVTSLTKVICEGSELGINAVLKMFSVDY